MRVPLIVGNWKMFMTSAQGVALVRGIALRVDNRPDVDVVVCPPFTALSRVHDEIRDSHIKLGAQNMFWEDSGAFTGQISPSMLLDLHVSYCIVGHSEARGRFGSPDADLTQYLAYFSESDHTVNKKIQSALFHSILPIICVGETATERAAGKTDEVVRTQVTNALGSVSEDEAYGVVFAYEPVWAIGTGDVCDEKEANRVCGTIRETLAECTNPEAADNVRILYGGSVKATSSGGLMREPEIDGLLVGGASLEADEFVQIVFSAQHE